MSSLQELMGQEIYDLLYIHYDKSGCLIDDMEDVFGCENEEIPQERIPQLEALLKPIHEPKYSLISLEACKLLAAWGNEKAIDYYQYCIDQRIDQLGNLEPHRLHTFYDTTYESFLSSTYDYYARCADTSFNQGEYARKKIFPLATKILLLLCEMTLDVTLFMRLIGGQGWKEYLPTLKECFLYLDKQSDDDLNKQWNIDAIKNLILEWEPEFFSSE
ncbi:hypothetical protein [Vibrio spartinae]|uniref:Uncharacterized protein n=1 Tax=Vibrio spartinae TaxID=1918945 RepID=A0A1N6M906_9VIBR|nr:hypothetical protein [Vibrio spartinae]SIO95894.1 hypothetical protein VSP9026_03647 [Vibrio spartinae]